MTSLTEVQSKTVLIDGIDGRIHLPVLEIDAWSAWARGAGAAVRRRRCIVRSSSMQAVQQVTGVDDTINPFVASLKPSKTMVLTGAVTVAPLWATWLRSEREKA